jgi:hypothetical protein
MPNEATILAELSRLKLAVEQRKTERERAAGALAHLVKQLRERFGCKTLKEGKAELERMKKEQRAIENRLGGRLAAFKERYPDL